MQVSSGLHPLQYNFFVVPSLQNGAAVLKHFIYWPDFVVVIVASGLWSKGCHFLNVNDNSIIDGLKQDILQSDDRLQEIPIEHLFPDGSI